MLLWISDTHFNFLRPTGFYSPVKRFGEYLMEENPDATGLILTGDVSTAGVLIKHLNEFAEGFTKPIYFVLGNHDYYNSSFTKIDDAVGKVVTTIPHLHWLNQGWHIHDGVAVVGVGGWYDAYHGNTNSPVDLNDFYDIVELIPGSRYRDLLLEIIRKRASAEADQLAVMLKEACDADIDTIVVGTHIAPYAESAWHEGKQSDRDWLPWFSSASTGAVLDIYAKRYPDKKFIVFCGHSHGSGIYEPHENMTVYTGKARYSVPDLAGVLYPNERKLWAYDPAGKKVERTY
jgi:predicted phosphohydrolase